LVELNVSSCSPTSIRHYDTNIYAADVSSLTSYINGLPLNTVLIGVTADEPQLLLDLNAKNAFLAIGVDLTGLQWAGKAIFVSQIGRPAITVLKVAAPNGNYLNMSVKVTGRPKYDIFINVSPLDHNIRLQH
jgi:Interleukin-like EMT inducer